MVCLSHRPHGVPSVWVTQGHSPEKLNVSEHTPVLVVITRLNGLQLLLVTVSAQNLEPSIEQAGSPKSPGMMSSHAPSGENATSNA